MSAFIDPQIKTVSIDSRNRVVLPAPTAKEFLVQRNDDGSYHLTPAVKIAQTTVDRIGKAIKAMQDGEIGTEISARQLSELGDLLENRSRPHESS